MVALVTGGGRGIGQGIALRLAKAGHSVAITARSADQLDETAKLAPSPLFTVVADVANPASVWAMTREVEQKLGPVDLLVNNAGDGGPFGRFWVNDPEEWWHCQEVNQRGPMLCCREVLPGMVARRTGCIINVVSGAGCQAFPDMSAYVVSKTAMIRFSEQLALELASDGVSVFPVRPGLVRTVMVEAARERLPYIQQMLDSGMENTAEAVGDLVLKLASGVANSLSGRLFSVGDNVDEIARRAEEIRRNEDGLLRART